MKKKLFIDLDDYDESRMQTLAYAFGNKSGKWDFDTIIEYAQGKQTWEAVKTHDEIYADTALINSYFNMGSSNLFNLLMHKAIEENVYGKSIFLFSGLDELQWHTLNKKMVDKAFRKNFLYVEKRNDSWSTWEQVDIDNLLKELL